MAEDDKPRKIQNHSYSGAFVTGETILHYPDRFISLPQTWRRAKLDQAFKQKGHLRDFYHPLVKAIQSTMKELTP